MSLIIDDLTVKLYTDFKKKEFFNVADSVSFSVQNGEIIAVVGESGSGKSFLGLSLMRLNPPYISEISSGSISISDSGGFEKVDIVKLKENQLSGVRGRLISMIFQDPNVSLNPVIKVGDQIIEAILAHKKMKKKDACDIAIHYLELMRIDGKARFNSYPHELSGGMRQRVMIAMAMVLEPAVLVADEPTTALDVKTSLQVLALIEKMRFEKNVSVLFITHDLSIARNISDKTIVFYAGQIMEYGLTEDIINNPAHPYSISLTKSVPGLSKDYAPRERLFVIPGSLSQSDFKSGKCRFYSRCFKKTERCLNEIPLLKLGSGRFARCVNI
ncbi:MAG: ABC transporter ATP-binding protein [Candidatus Acididesulfobacter guangdongensis]|uniref:ABC transporter ATP-binding protein n=1 Tax=Acididesulfobacter guangdongensis TaxID=2597225 RepID=A0A519BHN4_ACIG2|nr:MAG: ABC transporter ATP-binding protein [Candidatus Acididesulfobacter guangdongensis]